jgi:hypothetical protein
VRVTRDQHAWACAVQGGTDMPPAKPKTSKPRGCRPEREVVKAVAAALKHHPRVAWARRMNSGGLRDQHGHLVRFGAVGLPDFLGQLTNGLVLAVECKAEDGRLSTAQDAFIRLIQQHGGVAFVARGAEDVLNHLQ